MTDAKREAPAPSSLAGGEVREVREVMISLGWSIVESRGYGLICWGWSAPCEDGGESHKRRDWTEEQAWTDAEQVFNRRVERARVILAALSPEAPARDGDVAWACTACNSPRAVDPCPKCGTALTKPADGWDWPRLPDIERIRELAREVGYAVGVHGTLERDLDLIAAPWIAEAVTPLELAQHIASGLGGNVLDYKTQDKPCGRWSCNINSDGWFKLIDLSVMTPALTLRHEAPAEGAGERFTEGATLPDGAISGTDDGQTVWLESSTGGAHRLGIWGGLSLRFEEADGSSVVRDYEDVNLRARSSAPEAREGALGNLLAVIHGDGGHRALEVGVEQAAAEAEKIVADLLTAPSADKLRIAVEALGWYGEQARLARLSHRGGDEGRHNLADDGGKRARQALAALEAEGAK